MKALIEILKQNPTLVWKLSSSLLFVMLGGIILLNVLTMQLEDLQRKMFGGLILVYGLYRFITFVMEYRKIDSE